MLLRPRPCGCFRGRKCDRQREVGEKPAERCQMHLINRHPVGIAECSQPLRLALVFGSPRDRKVSPVIVLLQRTQKVLICHACLVDLSPQRPCHGVDIIHHGAKHIEVHHLDVLKLGPSGLRVGHVCRVVVTALRQAPQPRCDWCNPPSRLCGESGHSFDPVRARPTARHQHLPAIHSCRQPAKVWSDIQAQQSPTLTSYNSAHALHTDLQNYAFSTLADQCLGC